MTTDEIKAFFMITEKELPSFEKMKAKYTEGQLESTPELLIVDLLKKSYGFPISYFDEGKEDNITLTEKRSEEVYESFAKNILMGDYEDLYDFTQDLTAGLPTE
ncbi:MAG: hypothetical protein Q4B64_11940 [Spirochaetales bacterium]|nr:hypothetical protein [Spirochaetales bacterium]